MQAVHPSDRARYSEFLQQAALSEQTKDLQYRLIKKNGEVLYVNDTLLSKKEADGKIYGYSTLSDITELKDEQKNLQFLNETIPFGFIRYTCENQPKITFINDQLKQMLRFPASKDGEMNYLELFRENIYLLIPMEERRRFALYLNHVYTNSAPLCGEITVLRCDGSRARLFGWITKCLNQHGVEEFQSVFMDISESYQKKRQAENARYIKALSDVYDMIFEYDFANHSVKCLFAQRSPTFRSLVNLPMQMEEATQTWIDSTVFEDDREMFRSYIQEFFTRRTEEATYQPMPICYRATSADGTVKNYSGVFLKIDSSISLFCCRHLFIADETDALRIENASLKDINENMQELVKHFTDGLAAFQVEDEYVTPLYASQNVCHFFGYSKDEWLSMMKKKTPLSEFSARSNGNEKNIENLFRHGESEFEYFDLESQTIKRLKTVCSQKHPEKNNMCYVVMYHLDDSTHAKTDSVSEQSPIFIRTFGYFDVFVGDRPIAFRSQKSKELLALLVDRRGGYVTSEEAIGFLWEDEPLNTVTLARYRKVALRLKNILEEYGIADVIESVDGKRRVVPEKVRCDLYDYLSGKQEYARLFKGSYLTNYSWGENTLGDLISGTTE